MKPIQMNELIARLHDLRAQAEAAPGPRAVDAGDAPPADFASLLEQAVGAVNESQRAAQRLAGAFEHGEPGVSLVDVMVASQKAGLSFEALAQVRNHLVRDYHDVMNMPV